MKITIRKSVYYLAVLLFIFSTPLLADIRGTDINGKPVILRSNGTWSYITPPSNKTAACQRYTDNAIAQQRANQKLRCGFAGVRWHQDYNNHFNWCMSASAASRGAETIARRDALNRCTKGLKAKGCGNYARNAVAQQRQNQIAKCGLTGVRWHLDYNTHYNWCMKTKSPSHASETKIRSDALVRCTSNRKAGMCRNYTNNAIAQQSANLKRRCGYAGARWHQNYNTHYNWCMSVKAPSNVSETKIRRDALARCRPAPPPPGQHTFTNPKWQGHAVDNCVTWATNCGGGGADNFCRLKGYKKSSKWKHNRPGTTYVIGSKRVCRGGFCVGYSSITCTR